MLTDARINAFETFQTYSSLYLHFTANYDAIRYSFKTPMATAAKFESHRFRYAFERISRKYVTKKNIVMFFVCNFVEGNTFIASMSDDVYVKWQGMIESFTYRLKGELSTLKISMDLRKMTFDNYLKVGEDKQLPPIIDLLNSRVISLETVTCIDSLTGFTDDALLASKDSFKILKTLASTIQKYRPFLNQVIDLEKVRALLILEFTSDS
jgi:hypothetical protein